jgi:hypothetical protein
MSNTTEELLRLYENPAVSSLVPQVATAAPLYPVEGMMRYAKAPWNPAGNGEGFVYFINDNWESFSSSLIGLGTMSTQNANDVNITGGVISVPVVQDGLGNVRDIPINSRAADYTATLTDVGRCISINSGNVTIPNSVFSSGDVFSVFNDSVYSMSILESAGIVLYWAGTNTVGTRNLAPRGLATILCVSNGVFVVTGAGLT